MWVDYNSIELFISDSSTFDHIFSKSVGNLQRIHWTRNQKKSFFFLDLETFNYWI